MHRPSSNRYASFKRACFEADHKYVGSSWESARLLFCNRNVGAEPFRTFLIRHNHHLGIARSVQIPCRLEHNGCLYSCRTVCILSEAAKRTPGTLLNLHKMIRPSEEDTNQKSPQSLNRKLAVPTLIQHVQVERMTHGNRGLFQSTASQPVPTDDIYNLRGPNNQLLPTASNYLF